MAWVKPNHLDACSNDTGGRNGCATNHAIGITCFNQQSTTVDRITCYLVQQTGIRNGFASLLQAETQVISQFCLTRVLVWIIDLNSAAHPVAFQQREEYCRTTDEYRLQQRMLQQIMRGSNDAQILSIREHYPFGERRGSGSQACNKQIAGLIHVFHGCSDADTPGDTARGICVASLRRG